MSFNNFDITANEFEYACETGDAAFIADLLDSRTSLRIRQRKPLMAAILNNHVEVVRLLLSRGASDECLAVTADERESSPEMSDITGCLQFAAMHGKVDVVEALIRMGIAVDCVDRAGRTALGFAARAGEIDVVRLLVEAGASLTKVDKEGMTALDHAAAAMEVEVIEFLRWEMRKSKAKV
ncbi:ankyrin repeat-containing domain protein [Aspergillus nidulans var. acristatus]